MGDLSAGANSKMWKPESEKATECEASREVSAVWVRPATCKDAAAHSAYSAMHVSRQHAQIAKRLRRHKAEKRTHKGFKYSCAQVY